MRFVALLILLPCVLVTGCNGNAPLNSAPQRTTGATEDTKSRATNATAEPKPDLSVPRLDPKPLVWEEDFRPAELTPAREKAASLMAVADRLKAAEKFAEAEKYYNQAMLADPTFAFPAYQLACNYELWEKHDQAATQFQKAVELGFDDFPTALADDELGQIRDRPDFSATLRMIRERYIAASKNRVGQPIAVHASTAKPAEGWPVILFLHGYGDNNISYLDHAKEWADMGFVAVTVPGSVPASGGSFQWSMDSTEPTHQDLQAILQSPLLAGITDRKKVFLLGFSQGALHAMLLTAENPDIYAGVVALSPGGSLARRLVPPPLNRSQRPGRCAFIHGTQERHAKIVSIWSDACQEAGWKFYTKTHPGGHHFPENWDEMRPEVAKFLLE